jgi:antitoxin VapB
MPEELAFPGGVTDEQTLREGKRRAIEPADAVWDDAFEAPGIDLGSRDQPAVQQRAPLAEDGFGEDAQ